MRNRKCKNFMITLKQEKIKDLKLYSELVYFYFNQYFDHRLMTQEFLKAIDFDLTNLPSTLYYSRNTFIFYAGFSSNFISKSIPDIGFNLERMKTNKDNFLSEIKERYKKDFVDEDDIETLQYRYKFRNEDMYSNYEYIQWLSYIFRYNSLYFDYYSKKNIDEIMPLFFKTKEIEQIKEHIKIIEKSKNIHQAVFLYQLSDRNIQNAIGIKLFNQYDSTDIFMKIEGYDFEVNLRKEDFSRLPYFKLKINGQPIYPEIETSFDSGYLDEERYLKKYVKWLRKNGVDIEFIDLRALEKAVKITYKGLL